MAADLQRNVLNAIHDPLFNDPYIHDTAEAYAFPNDKQMSLVEKNGFCCLSFYIRAAFFEDWLTRHSDSIGAKFTLRNNSRLYSTNITSTIHVKKDRVGQIVSRYICYRKSIKY